MYRSNIRAYSCGIHLFILLQYLYILLTNVISIFCKDNIYIDLQSEPSSITSINLNLYTHTLQEPGYGGLGLYEILPSL